MRKASRLLLLSLLVVCSGLGIHSWLEGSEPKSDPAIPQLRIGLIKSLFAGNATSLSAAQPVGEMLGAQIGVRLEFVVCEDHEDMAKKLQKGEVQLGVIHGIEYAWAKMAAPELQPLGLALNQNIKLKAVLLVRNEDSAGSVADLCGCELLQPKKSYLHNGLFLNKLLLDAGKAPVGYFKQGKICHSTDALLDNLVDGVGRSALLDSAAWAVYQDRKPGRANKLRVLAESCDFPTAAILYKPGMMDANQEKSVRQGFLSIHEKPMGQQMLLFWRLQRFVPVTEEYNQLCKDILKDYPQPMQVLECTAK